MSDQLGEDDQRDSKRGSVTGTWACVARVRI